MGTKSIRLDLALVESAEKVSDKLFRSVPKQIEYWASLGQKVDHELTSHEISDFMDGVIDIEPRSKSIEDFSLSSVNEQIEYERSLGTLKSSLTESKEWFDISSEYSGYLVKKNDKGESVVGKFENGAFVPKDND